MTKFKKLRVTKFKKNLLSGMTQTDAAKAAGVPASSAHVEGSRMAKDPEVRNALEAAFRNAKADEAYLAGKIVNGVEKSKPGPTQLEYLREIKEGLGYSQKDSAPEGSNTFNILSIIQSHGLVGKDGAPIDAKGLVQP